MCYVVQNVFVYRGATSSDARLCHRFLWKFHWPMGHTTVRVDSLPHRKWREIQQQPGTAGPGNMLGCCLIFLHFLLGKLSTRTVQPGLKQDA